MALQGEVELLVERLETSEQETAMLREQNELYIERESEREKQVETLQIAEAKAKKLL